MCWWLGCLCLLWGVSGLLEKDVGSQELYFENVGVVDGALFQVSPLKKRVFVSTQSNVISALSLKNSQIGWRHVFPDNESISVLTQSSQALLSVSGQKRVSLFNTDGQLLWDTVLQSDPADILDAVFIPSLSNTKTFAILHNNTILISKEGVTQQIIRPKDTQFRVLRLYAQEDRLYGIGVASSGSEGSLGVIAIQVQEIVGEAVKQEIAAEMSSAPVKSGLSASDFVISSGYLITITNDEEIAFYQLSNFKSPRLYAFTDITDYTLKQFLRSKAISVSPILNDITSAEGANDKNEADFSGEPDIIPFILHSNDQRAIVSISTTSKTIQLVSSLTQDEQVSSASYTKDTISIVRISGRTLSFVNLKTLESLQVELPVWDPLATDSYSSDWHISKVWLKSNQRNDGTLLNHLLASGVDGGLGLYTFSTGKVTISPLNCTWKREEGSARVFATEFVDFPADRSMLEELTEEFSPAGSATRFFSHFKVFFAHLYQMVISAPQTVSTVFGLALKGQFIEGLSQIMPQEDLNLDKRDRFGFVKLIVQMSEVGKLYGIHSKSGKIEWHRYYPQQLLQHCYLVKKCTHTPPELVIVKQDLKSLQWSVSVLDPLTGAEITGFSLFYPLKHSFMTSIIDTEHRSALAFVDDHDIVHFYPESAEKRIREENIPIYYYLLEGESIIGYKVTPLHTQLVGQMRWKKEWEDSREKVVKVTDGVGPSGKVNAHGLAKVLWNNTVLWKYLNPNLIIVGTVSREHGENDYLNIYLIDVVTGFIVHRNQQSQATTPLHIVHAENWVVYNYWSTKTHNFEISTIELYKSADWEQQRYSSFEDPKPALEVYKNSYVLPTGLTTMAVTITNKGITNKYLLLGLQGGSVMSLDKRFVDARRPIRPNNRPTMEDQMEGVLPYFPIIEVNPLLNINYNISIPNLKTIVTAPTQLESSTLVMCLGLDQFYIPLTPGNTFDVISFKSSFNKPLILVGLLICFLSTLLANRLAQNAILKLSWL